MSSHGKGSQFEQQIGDLLADLQVAFPVRFVVTSHPRIELQSGEVVIPDFEIGIDLPHVHSRYLIECQDRQRNSKSILHKIHHVRAKSNRNKFLFVYNVLTPGEKSAVLAGEKARRPSRSKTSSFL